MKNLEKEIEENILLLKEQIQKKEEKEKIEETRKNLDRLLKEYLSEL